MLSSLHNVGFVTGCCYHSKRNVQYSRRHFVSFYEKIVLILGLFLIKEGALVHEFMLETNAWPNQCAIFLSIDTIRLVLLGIYIHNYR